MCDTNHFCTAGCLDGSVKGVVCGEEGEGQVGGAQVPKWSLQFLKQNKVCVCVCMHVCFCMTVAEKNRFHACITYMYMLGISTSYFYILGVYMQLVKEGVFVAMQCGCI